MYNKGGAASGQLEAARFQRNCGSYINITFNASTDYSPEISTVQVSKLLSYNSYSSCFETSSRSKNHVEYCNFVLGFVHFLPSCPSTIAENSPEQVPIAVIGGTGLQQLPGFTPVANLDISTPWGKTSSPISILHHPSPSTGKPIAIAFLSRHGLHHEYAPHEVPARANIAALRSLGVRTIIAFSAVGSLQEEIKPRDFVVPDQVIDRTKGIRPFTYFEGGLVGHVMFADPFDGKLGEVVRKCGHSLSGEGVRLHDKGTIICMGMFIRHLPPPEAFRDMRAVVANMFEQRARNSAPAPSRTCTAPGAAASSTCPSSRKPSSRVRPKSGTR